MPTVETTMARRTQTPGNSGWARSAQPGAPNKYFMVSSDCHANEPKDWVKSRIAPEYRERLPRLEMRDGQAFIITEGNRPWKIKTDTTDWGPEDIERNKTGRSPTERIADMERDGIDAEVVFGNKGIHAFGTNDAGFSMAMCQAWNDWAHEEFGAYQNRILPMAQIPTLDVDAAIREMRGWRNWALKASPYPLSPNTAPRAWTNVITTTLSSSHCGPRLKMLICRLRFMCLRGVIREPRPVQAVPLSTMRFIAVRPARSRLPTCVLRAFWNAIQSFDLPRSRQASAGFPGCWK